MSPQATRKEKGNSAHLGDCRTLGDIYAPAPLARPPGSHGEHRSGCGCGEGWSWRASVAPGGPGCLGWEPRSQPGDQPHAAALQSRCRPELGQSPGHASGHLEPQQPSEAPG